ncbi:MAG: 3-keto-5-aminohexanoate cleavage protein [Tistlia sp.]
MLQACLNGDRSKDFNAAVPCTPAELARDAAAARRAGAVELHFHPRDAAGRETVAPEEVADAVSAVRRAVPGLPLGLSTHWQIAPGGRARQAALAAWSDRPELRPDYVSVNLVEADAPEIVALMLSRGIGVEAGLWSLADAERFLALPTAGACLRVLIEINEQEVSEGLAVARAILGALDQAGSRLPRLLHGLNAGKWPLYREALALGLDRRVGFEDGGRLPDGAPAPDNAALVSAAAALERAFGQGTAGNRRAASAAAGAGAEEEERQFPR